MIARALKSKKAKSDGALRVAATRSDAEFEAVLADRLSRSMVQSFPGVKGKPKRPHGKPKLD